MGHTTTACPPQSQLSSLSATASISSLLCHRYPAIIVLFRPPTTLPPLLLEINPQPLIHVAAFPFSASCPCPSHWLPSTALSFSWLSDLLVWDV
ncbi:hypothetical protein PIB30_083874 [Stylosanthes scabra]|uniref:Uncharacterized protein n=1 Tax=Stylosanthes scabra TaxID=79078 RepID=A0ABU6SUK3_9FABA|nr:hypothetical protein [Stylosanthes scabra]